MYLGAKERRFNIYIDKTITGGWRYAKFHTYQCEKCGYISHITLEAVEPFYCGGKDCHSLIGIEPIHEKETQCQSQPLNANCSNPC